MHTTNQNEDVKGSIYGVDCIEDVVRADVVLDMVHQQEDEALQVEVEHDRQVELGHLGEREQVPPAPRKSTSRQIDNDH